jgi:tight adherence protein B
MPALALVAAGFAALATWITVPAWPDDRAGRLAGAGRASSGSLASWGREAVTRFGVGAARRRARERLRVIQALTALAGELQAGQPPGIALAGAAGTPPVWPAAMAAARLGQDVVLALRQDADAHRILRQLAACWQVAAQSGSGLSAAVSALADSARAAEDVRVQLEAELAGPRATARTLSVLPLVGLGFGVMMGADPLGWLLSTSPGLACLTAGIALTALGAWWTGRIATRVESML